MAEIITVLIVDPLFYLVADCYFRLAVWLCRSLGLTIHPHPMTEKSHDR